MTEEQYKMLQWLPKGEQAAMLQAQNAEFADGNADDLSSMRAATNAGVGSVFDQEQNGTFDAVSDPNSETIKSETTTTNADGTKTTTTTSNPNNSPSGRVAEDAKNPDQIRVTTSDGRFSAMIDPSMLEQYAAAGYKPGPQTATPNGGTMTTPNASEFDRSTLEQPTVGLARGGQGRAVVDTKPEPVMYSNGSQFPAYAVPGSPEAIALEAQGYAQGGVGQASLVKPGVTGNPVLDTQQDAQQNIITTAGEQAAQNALIANEGLGNSAITNQQAQDDARKAAEIAAASNYADVAGTTQDVIDQGVPPVDPAAVEANAFQQAEEDWAAQDDADTGDFITDGMGDFDTIDEEVQWAKDEFNFDNDIKGGFEDGATEAAIARDKGEGGYFEQLMNGIEDLNAETIQPWLESVNDWYKDNPVLASALGAAASNYIATGKLWGSISKGVTKAGQVMDDTAAAKATAAATLDKERRANVEFDRRAHNSFVRDVKKLGVTAQNKAYADKLSKDEKLGKEWGTYTQNLADRAGKHWTDKEREKFKIPDQTNAIQQASLEFQKNYDLPTDWFNNQNFSVNFGAGIDDWNEFNRQRVNADKPIVNSPISFIESGFAIHNSGLSKALFLGSDREDIISANKKTYSKMNEIPGATQQDAWGLMYDTFAEKHIVNGEVDSDITSRAEEAGMSPFIYFVNHLA